MDSTMNKIQWRLDAVTKFLHPFLPLANCHMVEFLTDNHWDKLLPKPLKLALENAEPSQTIDKFWEIASNSINRVNSNCELEKYITSTRSQCVAVDNETCLSVDQFQQRIKAWGGVISPSIHVNEFMTSKKGHEVQRMSSLVASLHTCFKTSYCVDLGGGRGNLPTVLSLGYGCPCITVDCDETSIKSGMKREKLIKKQWRAISNKVNDGIDSSEDFNQETEHKFVNAYVTESTDLQGLIRNSFPNESNENIRLLLTGLHTCGNLGPDSLRIFNKQEYLKVLFNVPCCYHLLSEAVDGDFMWDVFEKNYGDGEARTAGFPMSSYMKGYQLGRNARMLAAHSIDRVASLRQVPPKSLYYRAILQVLIKKYSRSSDIAEGKLKRLSSKCQSIEQYVTAADDILDLGLKTHLPQSELQSILHQYSDDCDKLTLFYLIKLCLAQVIENVILLDRLLFLKEMGFNNVFLVKLFDAVISPRCHAIVAVRDC